MESTLDDASSRDEELPVVVACEGGFVLILTSPQKSSAPRALTQNTLAFRVYAMKSI